MSSSMEWAERHDGQIFVALTLTLLAGYRIGWSPGQSAILIALALGVAFLGLPHGSLDLLVAKRLMRTSAPAATLVFVSVYVAVATSYGFLWWLFPSIGLASFLLISAVHFGSDWQDHASTLTRLAYGLAIVTLPAVRHGTEVAGIYAVLGAGAATGGELVRISEIVALPAVLFAFVGLLRGPRRRDLVEIVSIAAAALLLPPLAYFGLYFCCLHSPRHLLHTARTVGLRTPLDILRKVAAPTLAPLALAFFLFTRRGSVPVAHELMQLIFIGLAALTVPHMLLHGLENLSEVHATRKSASVTAISSSYAD